MLVSLCNMKGAIQQCFRLSTTFTCGSVRLVRQQRGQQGQQRGMHRRVEHHQKRRQRAAQVRQQLWQLLCPPCQCLQVDIPSRDAGLLDDTAWPCALSRQTSVGDHDTATMQSVKALKLMPRAHLQQQAGELARHPQQHVQQRCTEQLDDAGVRRRDALHGMQEPGC
jgi:hypothetical protein